MSSLSYRTTAGTRRKRKNAVDQNPLEVVDSGPRGKGRPSKGGAALRAKRYYVKNHLMVLEKRKLKRYTVKVRKYIEDFKYDAPCIMAKLKDLCEIHIRRHFQGLKESHLLYFINLSREDQYLTFLNDEGQLFMDTIYRDPADIPQTEELQRLQKKFMDKHSMLLFQFCTLFSAYLLVRYVEKTLQNTTFESNEARLEKMKSECFGIYAARYDHIIAAYKEQDESEQPEETEETEIFEKNEEAAEETEENNEGSKQEEGSEQQQDEESEQQGEETEQQDEETEQQDEETEQQDEETEEQDEESEQQDKETEQQDKETEQQNEETRQQGEEAEKQCKDCAKPTDVNKSVKKQQQEEDPKGKSKKEPAAKKRKTKH
ncbi:hypothetical protein V8B55DRAFT_1459181 [Mucor lusitanicus]